MHRIVVIVQEIVITYIHFYYVTKFDTIFPNLTEYIELYHIFNANDKKISTIVMKKSVLKSTPNKIRNH